MRKIEIQRARLHVHGTISQQVLGIRFKNVPQCGTKSDDDNQENKKPFHQKFVSLKTIASAQRENFAHFHLLNHHNLTKNNASFKILRCVGVYV